jgi:hypothetical protein
MAERLIMKVVLGPSIDERTSDKLHMWQPILLHCCDTVTPTFCKNKNFCANRSAYKNAYQIIVLVKNFPKIILHRMHCMAWHIIFL